MSSSLFLKRNQRRNCSILTVLKRAFTLCFASVSVAEITFVFFRLVADARLVMVGFRDSVC